MYVLKLTHYTLSGAAAALNSLVRVSARADDGELNPRTLRLFVIVLCVSEPALTVNVLVALRCSATLKLTTLALDLSSAGTPSD